MTSGLRVLDWGWASSSLPPNADGAGKRRGCHWGREILRDMRRERGEAECVCVWGGSLSSFLRCRSWLAATRSVCMCVRGEREGGRWREQCMCQDVCVGVWTVWPSGEEKGDDCEEIGRDNTEATEIGVLWLSLEIGEEPCSVWEVSKCASVHDTNVLYYSGVSLGFTPRLCETKKSYTPSFSLCAK